MHVDLIFCGLNHDAPTVQSRTEGLSLIEQAHVLFLRSQCFYLSGEPDTSRIRNFTPLPPMISVIQNLAFFLHSKAERLIRNVIIAIVKADYIICARRNTAILIAESRRTKDLGRRAKRI